MGDEKKLDENGEAVALPADETAIRADDPPPPNSYYYDDSTGYERYDEARDDENEENGKN
jgi:hypothetical protein